MEMVWFLNIIFLALQLPRDLAKHKALKQSPRDIIITDHDFLSVSLAGAKVAEYT